MDKWGVVNSKGILVAVFDAAEDADTWAYRENCFADPHGDKPEEFRVLEPKEMEKRRTAVL